MANKPKEFAAEEIARAAPSLIWFRGCPATDPAVGAFDHTVFFLEQDRPTQTRMMAVRLEAEAGVNRAMAEGLSNMAKALKGNG